MKLFRPKSAPIPPGNSDGIVTLLILLVCCRLSTWLQLVPRIRKQLLQADHIETRLVCRRRLLQTSGEVIACRVGWICRGGPSDSQPYEFSVEFRLVNKLQFLFIYFSKWNGVSQNLNYNNCRTVCFNGIYTPCPTVFSFQYISLELPAFLNHLSFQ